MIVSTEGQALSLEETADRGLRSLAADGPLRIAVTGNCMEPFFQEGQIVELAARRFFLPGDIVAFRPPGRGPRRLHRVLGYRFYQGRVCLVTRGDRIRRTDPPVPSDKVLGRVSSQTHEVTVSERLSALASFLGLAVWSVVRRLR